MKKSFNFINILCRFFDPEQQRRSEGVQESKRQEEDLRRNLGRLHLPQRRRRSDFQVGQSFARLSTFFTSRTHQWEVPSSKL